LDEVAEGLEYDGGFLLSLPLKQLLEDLVLPVLEGLEDLLGRVLPQRRDAPKHILLGKLLLFELLLLPLLLLPCLLTRFLLSFDITAIFDMLRRVMFLFFNWLSA